MTLADTLRDALGPDRLSLRDGVLVVSPRSAEDIQTVLRHTRAAGVSVVPEGGKTGLVGGTLAKEGQVILSLARLDKILLINATERVAVVEAGVTLEALQTAAALHALEPGIDLAARGSATIGGMLATNAGGVMAFRNGVMRHRVLGLEAVLPDGSLYSDLTRVVKNSAGYDLKHLLIGAEGTLGIITRVVLKLDPIPQATATALIGLPNVSAVLDLIARALSPQTGHLRAAEALWNSYLRLTAGVQGWQAAEFPLDTPLALILHLGGSDEAALREELLRLYAETLDHYPDATGLIASSARQERDIWLLHENTGAIYQRYPAAPS
ncbi:FAD-binding oxidoreductase [Stagnihabitans tardus]|uniref:FAD-binding protein n=1 Tax=Stagnihabitans tardus TaxID=2699202 RepID=A0AAE5BY88_9RHOB|nr:FAD-binding oxidoreductase [Stagnihabitans tardus]NBZ90108.1 FAD-binding protein [Stagnihabitans tardus]